MDFLKHDDAGALGRRRRDRIHRRVGVKESDADRRTVANRPDQATAKRLKAGESAFNEVKARDLSAAFEPGASKGE